MPDIPLHRRSRLKRYEISEESTPNYQFALWLKEWYEDAAAKDSKLQFAYRKALDSMIKWPEKLKSGRDAGKLAGIGPSISAKLEEKLRQQQSELGIVPEIPDGVVFMCDELQETLMMTSKQKKKAPNKKPKEKEYIPTFRSAPYSVLLALLLHLHGKEEEMRGGPLKKAELILKAQRFCTSSLNDGMFPCINGALKTLEQKGLIGKMGNPPHFLLTRSGLELSERLWKRGERRASIDSLPSLPSPSKKDLFKGEEVSDDEDITKDIISDLETFYWPIGSFDLILLVDVREIRSRDDRNYLTERLGQLGIMSEARNLELGDFIWVARRRTSTSTSTSNNSSPTWTDTEEIVLNVLIERKREDDLIASISDGRFKEQKHRISRCMLSETFYLVERGSGGNQEFLGGTEERLLSAALQCQVIDGLMYRQTGGLDESIVFLAALHAKLQRSFQDRTICACALKAVNFNYSTFPLQFEALRKKLQSSVFMNYTAYALLNGKSSNQSETDVFLRQLMSIKGVTFDKACAVVAKYPTPLKLHQFYQSLPSFNEQVKQDALSTILDGRKKKQFGRALSHKIYQIFSQKLEQ